MTSELVTDLLPVPERDHDSAPHWDGLLERRLVLQECRNCERLRYPAMSHCPYCAATGHAWRVLSGRGRVYSWIVVRRAFWPEFEAEVPYALLSVDLDEGVRLVARMDEIEALDFGLEVAAVYVTHPEWVELRFARPAAPISPTTATGSNGEPS